MSGLGWIRSLRRERLRVVALFRRVTTAGCVVARQTGRLW